MAWGEGALRMTKLVRYFQLGAGLRSLLEAILPASLLLDEHYLEFHFSSMFRNGVEISF